MPTPGFAELEQKWLAAWPENRAVAVFLDPAQRRRAHAFGVLVHELSLAAFHVREPQVAASKLDWWQQELGSAAFGNPHHPITQELFADDVARESDPTLWPALADGALAQLDQPGAGTLAALIEQLEPLHGAVAAAESALLLGGAGSPEANAALWTFSHLLHELPTLASGEGRLPLPLGLLARHGLARADLAQPSPARSRLLKDFLDELVLEINGALGVASARTLRMRTRVRLDRDLITAALKNVDPLPYLVTHARPGYWPSLWAAWREARVAARQALNSTAQAHGHGAGL
jgi:phytoene synthase